MNTKEIQDWLVNYIARLLHQSPGTIDIREPFLNYGLSSLDTVTLSGDLEELLARRLSPTLAYEYPNILLLSGYLTGNIEKKDFASTLNSPADISREPIAVIGMTCRFPGAKDIESFWQLLCDGIDTICEVPSDRWQKEAFYDPDPGMPGKSISHWGGFLDNIDQFDPFFFSISPREAKYMDPQQRLLMELSYEALDDAGQNKSSLDGTKTGVFIGISVNEYSALQLNDPSIISSHSGTGNALSIAANRISYFFNFHGPSIAIDTACSSSLSAVHLACQSLRNGECTMALAGGVNMIISPANSIAFTKAGVLAPDGRCKTFDAGANGYVRGEGAGVIVLKPLSTALADEDHIHAIILGSAISQDGRTNGLMAPSPEAQIAMLQQAYHAAGVDPGIVQYVEAHGTGTILGDAMEAKALGAVLGINRSNGPCSIGSVKTNIGHLEAAAGIAGLLKVILSLKHRVIPPSLHYHSPNPHISFDDLNLCVQDKLSIWPSGPGPAIAGVSSFGFGGTNVHMVLREANQNSGEETNNKKMDSETTDVYLLPLSANTVGQLHFVAGTFKKILTSNLSVSLHDICTAACKKRSMFDYRLAVIGNSRNQFDNSLEAFLRQEQDPNLFSVDNISEHRSKLVFVFQGQGGQWYGMGRDLLKQEPVFYALIERIDKVIQEQFNWSLMKVLSAEESISTLEEIDVLQPCLFAIQVGLAGLWQSWGITPDAVIGHSMGEVAAAHVAGILTLEEAIQIICFRSQLLKPFRGKGRMMVTELSPDQAQQLVIEYGNNIALAVINSPSSTVLSGDPETIQKVMDVLQGKNLFCKLVNVDVASHSSQMDELQVDLLKTLEGLQPRRARIPFYSSVLGSRGDELNFNAIYWMDNLRKPVLFAKAINQLLNEGHTTFIEIGPHPILQSSIQQTVQPGHGEVRLLPSLRKGEPEREVLLRSVGVLYSEGFSINWDTLYPKKGKYVELPPIGWQRQRYWMDKRPSGHTSNSPSIPPREKNYHPLLGDLIALANSPSTFIWQTDIDDDLLGFLEDHRIEDEIVFPAAAYIEMAWQAALETGINKSHVLADFVFKEKMILQRGNRRSVQVSLSPYEKESFLFSIYGRISPEENWKLYASVFFIENNGSNSLKPAMGNQLEIIGQQSTTQFTAEEFYKAFQLRGIHYGPAFRGVQQVWNKDNQSLGRIILPEVLQNNTALYQMHPSFLDACLQALAATQGSLMESYLYLPTGCRYIRFFSRPGNILWSNVTLQSSLVPSSNSFIADIMISDENNQAVAELIGFRLERIKRHLNPPKSPQDTWLYNVYWKAQGWPSSSGSFFPEKKNWLIFTDDDGLGEELAKQMEIAGNYCYLLSTDTINKRDASGEAALLESIEKKIKEITSLYGVIHLWSLRRSSDTLEVFKDAQLTCNSVLGLVKSLTARLAGLPRLWLVTRGAQSVKAGEEISVEQSALWGFGKVISFEFPELKCIRMDLDPLQTNAESVLLLLKQLPINDNEDQIAFRSGSRFVLRLSPFTLKASSNLPVALREDGTYLVTGGLGALGLATANWMATRGARHLVLLGRNEPRSSAINLIDQIRRQGVEVVIEQVDVTIHSQLEYLFEKMKKNMPPLRGIIHAAGVLDDGSILNMDSWRMKNVMAPKVEGTWNLHRLTMDIHLDFFVFYSSAVSVLGSPGQGNYASACSFLDAMAYYRRNLGLAAISINWGPWADIGLAAGVNEKLKEQNAPSQHLIKMIKIDRGLQILEQLLNESIPQVMVLPFDLKNLIDLYPTAAEMPFLSEAGGGDIHISRLYSRPNLRQKYVAPRNEIELKLTELWRQTLHIDQVGINDSFFELGGDSVLGAQILALAQKTFGIRINPQDAFQEFTINRLAEMLETEIRKQINEMSEEEAKKQLSGKN
ncbi:MAG: SDR family NAD(P)-dependent oxidoreductase [Ginsengibacter sp.]